MRGLFAIFVFAFALAAEAARPLARWDVVPYQFATGVFNAGVVAFHEKGVKVEFSVNSEKVCTVDERTLNPRTGIVEFVFPFDPSKYADGPVKIEAVATAPGEEPYALPPLTLYANSRKTLGSRKVIWADSVNGNDFAPGTKDEPVLTLKRAVQKCGDGGIVLLKRGVYKSRMIGGGLNRNYWTVIMAAPGLRPGEVKLRPGRTGTEKLCFRNVVFECEVLDGYGTAVLGENGTTSAWFDNCIFRNIHGRYSGETTPFGGKLVAYVTRGMTSEMAFGPEAVLLRSHRLSKIAKCAMAPNGCLVAGCTVDDVAGDGKEAPSYLVKSRGMGDVWIEDVIIYSLKASNLACHVFSGSRWRNSAVVDFHADPAPSSLVTTQFAGEMDNVVFADVDIGPQTWQWVTPKNKHNAFKPKDVRLFGVKTGGMAGYVPPEKGPPGLSESAACDAKQFPKGVK